jgi:hypothetical protein
MRTVNLNKTGYFSDKYLGKLLCFRENLWGKPFDFLFLEQSAMLKTASGS